MGGKQLVFAYLYRGMPVVSLNQRSSFTESCGVGGVKSQGSSTVLPKAAQTKRAGTEKSKK